MLKKLIVAVLFTLGLSFMPLLLLQGDWCIFSDFLHQQLPFILETKRLLSSGFPWWSWNTYLGADFVGSYSFYTLTSPFVWINCLFPEYLVPYGIALTFVLKFVCMALLCFSYLRKMGVSKSVSAFGAFLFTFSSFNITSIYYYHFYEPVMAFLVLLLAIEAFLQHERWGMLALVGATFLVMFINFYFALGSLMAALIYVICRSISGKIGMNFRIASKGGLAVLLGIVLCSFLLFPTIYQMSLTIRAQSHGAIDMHSMLNLLERFRSLLMPKIIEGKTIFVDSSGGFSNEACVAVVGLALAVSHILLHRNWLSYLLITLLLLYLTPMNGIFTLFTNPLYTRWAYGLTLVVVLCTSRMIDECIVDKTKIKKIIIAYLFLSTIIVAAFYINVLFKTGRLPGLKYMVQLLLFLMGVAATFLWVVNKLKLRNLVLISIAAVVIQMWLVLYNLHSINNGVDSTLYANIIENVELEKENIYHSRTEFHFEKHTIIDYNIGLLRNRPSTSTYHSVIRRDIDSLYMTVYNHYIVNKLRPAKHRDEINALLSVKDVYEIDSVGDISKQGARCILPIGFSYDSYIARSEFNALMNDTTRNLPLLMLNHLVIEDGDADLLDDCLKKGDADSLLNLDGAVAERRRFVASKFTGDSRGYTAQVDLPQESVMFFSVPFSKGFTATIDDTPTTIHRANLCLQAVKVPAGRHTIIVNYFPPWLKEGLWLSLVGLLLLPLIVISDKKHSG